MQVIIDISSREIKMVHPRFDKKQNIRVAIPHQHCCHCCIKLYLPHY